MPMDQQYIWLQAIVTASQVWTMERPTIFFTQKHHNWERKRILLTKDDNRVILNLYVQKYMYVHQTSQNRVVIESVGVDIRLLEHSVNSKYEVITLFLCKIGDGRQSVRTILL